MTSLQDRGKALENKYFHDEGRKFRIISRRRKLMGLWAAEQMHLDESEANKYALDIVELGMTDSREGAVVNHILKDLLDKGVSIDEDKVREVMYQFHDDAEKTIHSELQNSEAS